MKPSRIAQNLIKTLTKNPLPPLLWGPPGVGKTAVAQSIADHLNFDLIDWVAPVHQPVDLTGGLRIEDGYTFFCPPKELATISRPTLFLIDDIGFADERMQQALLKLIHERKLGEHKLPDFVYFMATSNRLGDRAGVRRLLSPLKSRFTHIDFQPDVDDWLAWADDYGIVPEIRSYIAFARDRLVTFDPNVEQETFACPRTWHALSDVFHFAPAESRREYFKGIVGDAATELMAHMELFHSLPPANEIAEQGLAYKMPDDPATRYVVVTSLGDYAKAAAEQKNTQHLRNILLIANAMPADFGVLLGRALLKAAPLCQSWPEMSKFLAKHAEVTGAY